MTAQPHAGAYSNETKMTFMQPLITPDTETLYYCPQRGGYVSSSQVCAGTVEPDTILQPVDQADKFTRPPFAPAVSSNAPVPPTGTSTATTTPAPAQSSILPWLIGGFILLMIFSKDK